MPGEYDRRKEERKLLTTPRRSLTFGCDPLNLGIRGVDANRVLRIGIRRRLEDREELEPRRVAEGSVGGALGAANLALDLQWRRISSRQRSHHDARQ